MQPFSSPTEVQNLVKLYVFFNNIVQGLQLRFILALKRVASSYIGSKNLLSFLNGHEHIIQLKILLSLFLQTLAHRISTDCSLTPILYLALQIPIVGILKRCYCNTKPHGVIPVSFQSWAHSAFPTQNRLCALPPALSFMFHSVAVFTLLAILQSIIVY